MIQNMAINNIKKDYCFLKYEKNIVVQGRSLMLNCELLDFSDIIHYIKTYKRIILLNVNNVISEHILGKLPNIVIHNDYLLMEGSIENLNLKVDGSNKFNVKFDYFTGKKINKSIYQKFNNLLLSSNLTAIPFYILRNSFSIFFLCKNNTEIATGAVLNISNLGGYYLNSILGVSICVLKEYQNHGLSSILNHSILKEGVKIHSAEKFFEIVRSSNYRSIRMNESCGLKISDKQLLFLEYYK